MLHNGDGIEQNLPAALAWYEKVAASTPGVEKDKEEIKKAKTKIEQLSKKINKDPAPKNVSLSPMLRR